MPETSTQELLLAERYGIKVVTEKRKRVRLITAAAAVMTFSAGAIWVGYVNYDPVQVSELSFEVVSDWRTDIEIEAIAPIGSMIACELQAMSSDFAIVGQKTVQIGPTEQTTTRYIVTLETTAKAVTGVVERCQAK